MAITSPEQMHQAWADAYNKGDIDALLALYEDEAAFVQPGGEAVIGKSQLRAALEEILALEGTIVIETKAAVQTGDVALTVGQWSVTGTDPDGQPVELGATSAEVLRRQADGSWLHAIDNPWGDAIASG